MPAKLKDNGLTRLIKVYGIEQPVVVTILPEGISFKIAGRGGQRVIATWPIIVKACVVTSGVKGFDPGDPFGYLQREAQKKTKRKAKESQ